MSQLTSPFHNDKSQCPTRRAFPAEYNDPPGSTELSGIAQRDNENWWRYEDMQVDGYSLLFQRY
jgi:hypothetical protein